MFGFGSKDGVDRVDRLALIDQYKFRFFESMKFRDMIKEKGGPDDVLKKVEEDITSYRERIAKLMKGCSHEYRPYNDYYEQCIWCRYCRWFDEDLKRKRGFRGWDDPNWREEVEKTERMIEEDFYP